MNRWAWSIDGICSNIFVPSHDVQSRIGCLEALPKLATFDCRQASQLGSVLEGLLDDVLRYTSKVFGIFWIVYLGRLT